MTHNASAAFKLSPFAGICWSIFLIPFLVVANLCPAEEVNINSNWKFHTDPNAVGVTQGWMQPGLDDSRWETLSAESSWAEQGHFDYDGVAWYRKRIVIEPRFRGKFIVFDAIDDNSTIYFDGKQVATNAPSAEARLRGYYISTPPFRLRLPDSDAVLIAVRVAGTDTHRIYARGPGLARDVKLSDEVLMSAYGYWLAPDKFVSHADWLKALWEQRSVRRKEFLRDGRIHEGPYSWIQKNFVEAFVFVYDTRFYDYRTNRYKLDELLDDGIRRFGGYDSLLLWQSYTNIGADDQNQFQMIRDLPGGVSGLKSLIAHAHRRGVRVFFTFNPWDTGTKQEPIPPEQALAEIIRETDADGAFLDTYEPDSKLRVAVDAAKPGILLEPEGSCYSESYLGTINACWGQGYPVAGYYDHIRGIPIVKWTEPRHMIHYDGDRWRHSRTLMFQHAFLNGTGVLIWEDVFGTWNPYTERDQAILRRMIPIERYAADLLASDAWEPFYPTLLSSVDASYWPGSHFSLWTFVNWGNRPTKGQLLTAPIVQGRRYFDLWHGIEIHPQIREGKILLTADLEARGLGAILAYQGEPDKKLNALLSSLRQQAMKPLSAYSDEWSATKNPSLITQSRTKPASLSNAPPDMVLIPTIKDYVMTIIHNLGESGCYPDDKGADWSRRQYYMYEANDHRRNIIHQISVPAIPAFYMDKYLVTNQQYRTFLESSGYRPSDRTNFLRDWDWSDSAHPKPMRGFGDHPVVWVDLDDARAYAHWAGKRLPTEEEWQYAAGGAKMLRYPWGNTWDSERANDRGTSTSSVTAFLKGINQFGLSDMSGNVWEWTESERNDGNRYAMLRGGSFYQAEGENWYFDRFAHLGLSLGEWSARPTSYHVKLFLMSPSMDRKATIGFRCVKDTD